jgi:aspartyl-tRNA(Asn)/glutamyl-tRNA(Gln) amidotransferase subunit B
MIEEGEEIKKETRGWIESKGETVSQRSKEFAHDYRYFPEPDLPSFEYSQEELDKIKSEISEQPKALESRFQKDYKLSSLQANQLITKRLGGYFENVIKAGGNPHLAYDWMINERLQDKIKLENFVEFIKMIKDGKISATMGKEIAKEMVETNKKPSVIIQEKGLKLISDEKKIEAEIENVLAKNQKAVSDYLAGRQQALGFLVGQVMREVKGQANPEIILKILKDKLK